jgi:methylglutaconyl-CoA hydratase
VFNSIEALDSRIFAHAQELVGYNPQAIAELKKAMWRGTEDWDTLLAERATVSGRLVLSDFTKGAIAKFKAEAAKR